MNSIVLAAACSAAASGIATITSAWLSARWQRALLRELAETLTKAANRQAAVSNQ